MSALAGEGRVAFGAVAERLSRLSWAARDRIMGSWLAIRALIGRSLRGAKPSPGWCSSASAIVLCGVLIASIAGLVVSKREADLIVGKPDDAATTLPVTTPPEAATAA